MTRIDTIYRPYKPYTTPQYYRGVGVTIYHTVKPPSRSINLRRIPNKTVHKALPYRIFDRLADLWSLTRTDHSPTGRKYFRRHKTSDTRRIGE